MELYFLRHGLAGDRDEWTGDDAERPLTDAGKAQTAREAAGLARLSLIPDLILTSPLVRARQTAEILAQELGIPDRVAQENRLRPGFGRKRLRKILDAYGNRARLMLVGHEPDFSKVVGRLIGGAQVTIEKGGLAGVALDDPVALAGSLLYLATPAMLEAQPLSEEHSQ